MWITLNFQTLNLKIHIPRNDEEMENRFIFSFMEKMNRIKFRYLITEFAVKNTIDYINNLFV